MQLEPTRPTFAAMSGRKLSSENPALSPVQVAVILGVSKSTVYQMIRQGILPHVQVTAGRIVIEPDELEKYLALRRHTAEQAADRWVEVTSNYR